MTADMKPPEKSETFDLLGKETREAILKGVSKGIASTDKEFAQKNPRQIAVTLANTIKVIEGLGIECSYDIFHDRAIIAGLGGCAANLASVDDKCLVIRNLIIENYKFDPGASLTAEAVRSLCILNQFDPVVNYLKALRWDGTARLDKWTQTYLGAEDTQFNSAIGRKVLIAAVRRALKPGTKFDYVMVLDSSRQGAGKSTAIKILAGADNFSDAEILGARKQEQQESVSGVWLYELSELTGIRKADIGKVKAFISRDTDSCRPAYGRTRVDRPRRCVFIGTSNDHNYLQDHTGNRRFWPITPGSEINLEGLRQDRDQLWAEAVVAEASGEELVIDRALWKEADRLQRDRIDSDPWEDIIRDLTPRSVSDAHPIIEISGEEVRVFTKDILFSLLGIEVRQQTNFHFSRVARIMMKLGWEGPKTIRKKSGVNKGYTRSMLAIVRDGKEESTARMNTILNAPAALTVVPKVGESS